MGSTVRIVGFVLGCSLGCSGWVQPPSPPQPVTLSYDGGTQTLSKGTDVVVPDDFPLPMPPGLRPESAIFSDGDGPSTVSFRLDSPQAMEQMVVFYTNWMEEQQLQPRVSRSNLAGTRSVSIEALTRTERLTVTLMDGMGARILTLMVSPR